MQVYFIRHAQSSNNALWVNTGSSLGRSDDPELTDLGWRQARIVADFVNSTPGGAVQDPADIQNLNGLEITHLYSSLMTRALSTAHCIAEEIGLPVRGWVDLHECGGIYLDDEISGERVGLAGKTAKALAERFPLLQLPDGLPESGWWSRPYENQELWYGRARRVYEQLMRLHGDGDDRVALVSHGCFFRYFLCAVFGLEDSDGLWFEVNNAAISRLEITPDSRRIFYLNRVDFLPREMIS